jgi:hypothetical protein
MLHRQGQHLDVVFGTRQHVRSRLIVMHFPASLTAQKVVCTTVTVALVPVLALAAVHRRLQSGSCKPHSPK